MLGGTYLAFDQKIATYKVDFKRITAVRFNKDENKAIVKYEAVYKDLTPFANLVTEAVFSGTGLPSGDLPLESTSAIIAHIALLHQAEGILFSLLTKAQFHRSLKDYSIHRKFLV